MKLLDSIKIVNFRGIKQLEIPHLAQVNLIVGKNNSGKSSLLEALWLYAHRGAPDTMWRLIEARNEGQGPRNVVARSSKEVLEQILTIKYLFYGRPGIQGATEPIIVDPASKIQSALEISIEWLDGTDERAPRHSRSDVLEPYIVVKVGNNVPAYYRLDTDYQIYRSKQPVADLKKISTVFIPVESLSAQESAELWDAITLTPVEDTIIEYLGTIFPEVEALNFVEVQGQRYRIPKVRVKTEVIPLKSMGDGVNRLFSILLALVNARGGLLLIDEIENGLHYSIQSAVWKLIFNLSRLFEVQVFATSHSMDCIRAFQDAANDDQAEGMLIRLEAKQDYVKAVTFDEQELTIVASEKIEVR